ncbi:FGGY family carbohydrate kinase [Herbiconiux sp. L3-i23]|uniref:FGGY family carbohydrate kinase n=1 Tax=Herbiconiux sp. L3-i23 TaxID=2905871 RepID=UPI00205834BB|nr:FGGY family carbohydrate kinase [Herbiconiux sp. L3-i23]BDI21547.1 glycerol kinase [Herbiconiux sp. L3-i23]
MADDTAVLIAVDQGTSSTKTVAVDEHGTVLSTTATALGAEHPAPGWVQQDAREILAGVRAGIDAASERFGARIAGVGLSSQRESAIAWSRRTGEPLGPVLGWQDRRTADRAESLADSAGRVRAISGLPLDPMFSALKFAYLLDEIDPDRSRSRSGEIALGTVDSWLLYALTGEHRIEVGNASRTQLLDLATADWSGELLDTFGIPAEALPRIAASDEASEIIVGTDGLRFHAVLGDSHAALFGHGARGAGAVKVTYGTGSSIMGLEADGAGVSHTGLVRTIAWQTGGAVARAFEGNILSTGATLVWLAEVLGTTPTELVALAADAQPSAVDLVPAFSGLGAPWWDERATAVLTGFELGTSRAAIARAAVESIPLQIEDVLVEADDAAGRVDTILADGGPSSNDWLVQLQADLSQRTVVRSGIAELSALGAAHLAGIASGVWSADDVDALPRSSDTFTPILGADAASERRARWLGAVSRSRSTPRVDADIPPLSRSTDDRN